jgi:hypothetical protein
VKGYYESLLAADNEKDDSKCSEDCSDGKPKASQPFSSEKWKGQIEKVHRLLPLLIIFVYLEV